MSVEELVLGEREAPSAAEVLIDRLSLPLQEICSLVSVYRRDASVRSAIIEDEASKEQTPTRPDPDDTYSVREVAPEYGPSEDTDTLGPVPFAGPRMLDVPLRHGAAAGEPRETFFLGDVFAVEASRLKGPATDYAAFEIAGNSMTNAGINDGDIVIIRKTREARDRQIHLFRHEGKFTLKRFERDRDGTVRLAYDDGSGDSVVVEPGDWEVVGAFCFVAKKEG